MPYMIRYRGERSSLASIHSWLNVIVSTTVTVCALTSENGFVAVPEILEKRGPFREEHLTMAKTQVRMRRRRSTLYHG
jgi:hypothetical protein